MRNLEFDQMPGRYEVAFQMFWDCFSYLLPKLGFIAYHDEVVHQFLKLYVR